MAVGDTVDWKRLRRSMTMRLAGHVARMKKKRNAYRILEGKPEGNRPLGR
jgi:hypothetical protein